MSKDEIIEDFAENHAIEDYIEDLSKESLVEVANHFGDVAFKLQNLMYSNRGANGDADLTIRYKKVPCRCMCNCNDVYQLLITKSDGTEEILNEVGICDDLVKLLLGVKI